VVDAQITLWWAPEQVGRAGGRLRDVQETLHQCLGNFQSALTRYSGGFRGVAMTPTIHPLIAAGVVLATAATDAVYVMFTSAVVARRRVPAASWSGIWYLLSSFAVISYTQNWIYVIFAAAGSWIGAFVSITFLQRSAGNPPGGPAPP
jgi:hypothetical protein